MSHLLFIKKNYFYFLLGMLVISLGMFAPVVFGLWIGIPVTILCFPCLKWCFKKSNQYSSEDKSNNLKDV